MGGGQDGTVAHASPRVSREIGKYRLVAELGAGGMASVYLAVMRSHAGFHKLVVLKIPKDVVYQDPQLLAMFLDEARIAARLNHPNVVQTFEVFHEAGRDVIVMEYLDGYTLHELIVRAQKHGTPLPKPLHLRIVSEALTGLQYAHDAKDFDGRPLALVHRDVSPHNVFVTFDGQVKVLDFGIAKAATQSHQTEFGTFKGKVRYMPREQLFNGASPSDRDAADAQMDGRTDIFSVGVMIWEAAVGERLWGKRNDVEVMSAIIAGEIPMPRDVAPNVPVELDAICRRAMAHAKEQRYPTCLELRADVDRWLESQGPSPTMREVVAFLETVFATQRAARQTVIDEQMKLVDLGAAGPIATMPSAMGSDAYSPAFGATSPTFTTTPPDVRSPPPPARTSRLGAVVLAVGALVFAGAAIAGVALFLQARARRSDAATVAVATTASVATEAAPSASASSEPPPPTETVAPPPVSVAARSSSESAAPPTPRTMTKTPTGHTPPPKPQAPKTGHAVAAPAEPPGTLSFTTYPWTRVSENGRVLGTTPLYKVPMSAGVHVLTLENPDENLKTTYSVTIKSGEALSRNMALK